MHFFYHPFTDKSVIEFTEDEFQHFRVLRINSGDEINVINGKGSLAKARVMAIGKKNATAEIISTKQKAQRPFNFSIAVAPVKSTERMEWMVEKLCELGAAKISFISTERTIRVKLNEQRFSKLVVSACKQSGNLWFPEMDYSMMSFGKFVSDTSVSCKLIAYCSGNQQPINSLLHKQSDTLVLIGPEGDFTNEEFELAVANGFKAVSLGENRLRTETAAIYAASGFNFVNAY